jgi:hypothetical protein
VAVRSTLHEDRVSVHLIHEGQALEMNVTAHSYILLVLEQDPQRWVKAWRCLVLVDEMGGDHSGDVVTFEERILRTSFSRLT